LTNRAEIVRFIGDPANTTKVADALLNEPHPESETTREGAKPTGAAATRIATGISRAGLMRNTTRNPNVTAGIRG